MYEMDVFWEGGGFQFPLPIFICCIRTKLLQSNDHRSGDAFKLCSSNYVYNWFIREKRYKGKLKKKFVFWCLSFRCPYPVMYCIRTVPLQSTDHRSGEALQLYPSNYVYVWSICDKWYASLDYTMPFARRLQKSG